MLRKTVVPIQLGCCNTQERCLLCSPAPSLRTPEFIRALIESYQKSKGVSRPVVSFFGGAVPTPAQVAACDGLPFTVRVRPDLLAKKDAQRLISDGATSIELDMLTLHDPSLKAIRRKYRRKYLLKLLEGLHQMNVKLGVVLSPGLPDSSYDTCLDDARVVAGFADTVRIHPVLVYAEAGLRERHMNGSYVPLEIGEAVTVCAGIMDLMEDAAIPVIRVGVQPGPDETGRVVAGPFHPSFRQLVGGRRALRTLDDLLSAHEQINSCVIHCHPSDETRTRGPLNQNIRTLRADHNIRNLKIMVDSGLDRGQWRVEVEP